ncbi:alpha-amylase family glycosyl hydrolase [Tessaracoccus sp. MC1756]|uniref:alpha-amylase family glycosyl hydrolase n=1 Tax=Tessaracoccus sp. MC1756 TaxID=2760311 RepID=UPI0015FFAE51|nr:alpha-amylase family glycosyl hydrolase [Tessaracoccus sp. MC1756]MBB1510718.1 alpha-amylase [Tessaracoccus sp. MC1756]
MLEHAIWWHVYPLGATGAPIRTEHGAPSPRLRKLDAWLDYAVELGCNGLLLGPVFQSVSHGYDTLDHYRIDARLGDDTDFDHLVEQSRARGMHIILDGVFNHVAREHRLVGERPELVRWEGDRPKGWEGHDALVELDHGNPEVLDLVVDIMLHWLRRGIAGWRLDVAYAVPASFWRAAAERVRAEFPDAVFVGEVIHGDYLGFIGESTLTTLTQYELWKGIWSSLTDVNGWELAHAIERHAVFAERFLPNTFLGNHDVSRIATRVPRATTVVPYLLMALPGAPSIYYGDEQGFTGTKTETWHGDDEIRPPLPETPAGLSSLGAHIWHHYRAAVALRRRHPWLATASVEVLDKSNEHLTYRVYDGGRALTVDLDLATPGVRVTGEGEHLHIVALA